MCNSPKLTISSHYLSKNHDFEVKEQSFSYANINRCTYSQFGVCDVNIACFWGKNKIKRKDRMHS